MYKIIEGGMASDDRGEVRFVNEFDMTSIKRFYTIKSSSLEYVRGWRAHRIEKRWFYVVSGAFRILLVEIDDWINPDRNLEIESVELKKSDNRLLHLPAGYGTALKALVDDSEILVFSDYPLSHADNDNYVFDLGYFINFTK